MAKNKDIIITVKGIDITVPYEEITLVYFQLMEPAEKKMRQDEIKAIKNEDYYILKEDSI